MDEDGEVFGFYDEEMVVEIDNDVIVDEDYDVIDFLISELYLEGIGFCYWYVVDVYFDLSRGLLYRRGG